MGKFKKFFEEVTSGDIATVDNILGDMQKRPKRLQKGKKCKKHKKINCDECRKHYN